MKKVLLIILNLLLAGGIILSAFYLKNVLQERHLTNFIKEQQTQLAPKEGYDKQEGNIGNTHVTAYFPTDAIGNRIQPIENLLNQTIREHLGEQKPNRKIKGLAFFSTADTNTNFPAVRRTTVAAKQFAVDGFKIAEKESNITSSILLTTDNQQFTLETLFSDVSKAKEVITAQIKADLEAKQVPAEQVSNYLTAANNLDWKTLAFDYDSSKLSITLPEKEAGLQSVSIEISRFYDMINSQYLSESDLQAYKAYQEEKAKKTQVNMIALTFDDGPSAETTPKVLDILKKYNIKATFFVMGQHVEGNEAILKRMAAEGHEIANHSWSHPNLTKLSPEQIRQEIEQTQSAIENVTGKRPTMLRPPYGSINQTVMDTVKLPSIYWSVDSLDWKSRNPQAILTEIKTNTSPGSIILMHDIHQPTVDSLESVIQYLQSQGYSFGTIPDLLGKDLDPQLIYYSQTNARPLN